MCTRFYMDKENEIIRKLKAEAEGTLLSDIFVSAGKPVHDFGEIRPTDVVPVIASSRNHKRKVFPMKWGFSYPNRPLIVNARTETASIKPTFREAWRIHRCIIPASFYFEWEHRKDDRNSNVIGNRFRIKPKEEEITWLCGLYRTENSFPCFTVLTKEPTESLLKIHDRMPLILPEDRIEDWINPDKAPEDILGLAVADFLIEVG